MPAQNIEEIEAAVLEFVQQAVHPAVERDTLLLADGLLDSFIAVELLAFLEGEFDLRIESDAIVPEDLTNVRSISRLVVRTREASGAPQAEGES